MSNIPTGVVNALGAKAPITAPGSSPWTTKPLADCSIQVSLAGTGQVDAVVHVEVSNGPSTLPVACGTPAAVITLSSAVGLDADGFILQAPWKYVRFTVITISGTGASVTGLIGS